VFSSLTDGGKRNFEMNVMDVSMIDINIDNKTGNNNLNDKYFSLNLNDDTTTNLNIEFQFPVGLGMNESFQAPQENNELPVILAPEANN
jgi:hypothetical protein